MPFPQFESKIKERLIQPSHDQRYGPNYGIILNYDNNTNRVSVLMSQAGSDEVGQVFHDVPFPTTSGTQMMAPKPGTPCFVMFKDNNSQFPVVSHTFNHVFHKTDVVRHNRSLNITPRYMYTMG